MRTLRCLIQIGRQEGRRQGHQDIALQLLKRGYALSEITELTGLTLANLEELKQI